MSNIWVKNGITDGEPANFSVSVLQVVDKGPHDGDLVFVVEVGTRRLDKDGKKISSIVTRGTGTTVNEVIEKAIASLCDRIDWGNTQIDTHPPNVSSVYPPNNSIAPLNAAIQIRLSEQLPSLGINKDTIKMKINGIDVNPEIIGNPYDYIIQFRPVVTD